MSTPTLALAVSSPQWIPVLNHASAADGDTLAQWSMTAAAQVQGITGDGQEFDHEALARELTKIEPAPDGVYRFIWISAAGLSEGLGITDISLVGAAEDWRVMAEQEWRESGEWFSTPALHELDYGNIEDGFFVMGSTPDGEGVRTSIRFAGRSGDLVVLLDAFTFHVEAVPEFLAFLEHVYATHRVEQAP